VGEIFEELLILSSDLERDACPPLRISERKALRKKSQEKKKSNRTQPLQRAVATKANFALPSVKELESHLPTCSLLKRA
jgi:hypothetical protein